MWTNSLVTLFDSDAVTVVVAAAASVVEIAASHLTIIMVLLQRLTECQAAVVWQKSFVTNFGWNALIFYFVVVFFLDKYTFKRWQRNNKWMASDILPTWKMWICFKFGFEDSRGKKQRLTVAFINQKWEDLVMSAIELASGSKFWKMASPGWLGLSWMADKSWVQVKFNWHKTRAS